MLRQMGTAILNWPTTFNKGAGQVPSTSVWTRQIVNGNNLPMSQTLSLNDQPVEVVECFKYLGTQIDDKLSFTENATYFFKASQHLFLIGKLKEVWGQPGCGEDVQHSGGELLHVQYDVQSGMAIHSVWYGNLSVTSKSKLTRIVNTASKVTGRPQALMSSLSTRQTKGSHWLSLAIPPTLYTLSLRGFPLAGTSECPWPRKMCLNMN